MRQRPYVEANNNKMKLSQECDIVENRDRETSRYRNRFRSRFAIDEERNDRFNTANTCNFNQRNLKARSIEKVTIKWNYYWQKGSLESGYYGDDDRKIDDTNSQQ